MLLVEEDQMNQTSITIKLDKINSVASPNEPYPVVNEVS